MLTIFGSINVDQAIRVPSIPQPGETVVGERVMGFYRKFVAELSVGLHWTYLCCERCKLLEWGELAGLELPFSDHVCGLDLSQCCIGRMEGLEAKHGARDPLYETVILFHDVFEVFDLKDLYAPPGACEFEDDVDAFQTRQIGAAFGVVCGRV